MAASDNTRQVLVQAHAAMVAPMDALPIGIIVDEMKGGISPETATGLADLFEDLARKLRTAVEEVANARAAVRIGALLERGKEPS